MKLKLFLIAVLFSLSLFIPSALQSSERHKQHSNAANLETVTTFERILIDGIWWIIEYQDGVKIMQYIDPDQL